MIGIITQERINTAMTWEQYLAFHKELVEKNTTTAVPAKESLVANTVIVLQRAERFIKRIKMSDDFKAKLDALEEKEYWCIIVEPWCTDASTLLALAALSEAYTDKVEVRVFLRDSNLDIMDAYLTNGGRSIPKLVRLNQETLEEAGQWGPRPAPLQKMATFRKANPDTMPYSEFTKKALAFYAKDKGRTVMLELFK